MFDVYRRGEGDVLLVDFNPYGLPTDSLFFTWPELTSQVAPRIEPDASNVSYSGPYMLGPPFQPENWGLKLKAVLK